MPQGGNTQLSDEFTAAFAWWRDAGVDLAFHDEPETWLAAVEDKPAASAQAVRKPPQPVAPPEPEAPKIDAAALPANLPAFAQWWLGEPLLDDGRTSGRIAPRGEAGAPLMVLVAEPEREDGDSLLSGPQGRLLDAFLTAAGIAPDQVYRASALPRHTPMADWQAAIARGIGAALRHHVKLASPARLIAFGGNTLSLLQNDPPISGQFSQHFNHEGLSIPLFAATDIAVLLARPRAKARMWQHWLEWTGPDWMGN